MGVPWAKGGTTALLFATLLAACHEVSEDPGAVTSGDRGSAEVSSPGRWEFQELGRLGGLDAPPEQQFQSHLLAVRALSGGRLLVVDQQMALIRIFSRDGTLLSEFGGIGDGPGELNVPVGAAVTPSGGLVVPNAFNGRYTIYDPGGVFVQTTPRATHRTFQLTYTLPRLSDSTFVDQYPSTENGTSEVTLVEVTDHGRVVDTLSSVRLTSPRRGPGGPLRPGSVWSEIGWRFSQNPIYLIHSEGSVWAIDRVRGRAVHQRLDGEVLAELDLEPFGRPLTRTERELIARGLREARIDASEVDLGPSLFLALLPGPAGSLLAQRTGEMGVPLEEAVWFGSDGVSRGTVDLGFMPGFRSGFDVVGDTLFGVGIGEMDVPFVTWGTLEPTRR
jgi:hypothetical protein